jgi:hypothetical protein
VKNRISLRELEAVFLRWEGDPHAWMEQDEKEGANGVLLLCPACFVQNGGRIGTHSVICWDPTVPLPPAGPPPAPGRWALHGTGIDDLSLVAGSSSIALTGGCAWHGWIRDGHATW